MEKKYDEQLAETNVLRLGYDATLADLENMRLEHKKASDGRDTKFIALGEELAVLRSKRTNPQVEQDKISRAIRDATRKMKIEIDKADVELEKKQTKAHEKREELDQKTMELKEA